MFFGVCWTRPILERYVLVRIKEKQGKEGRAFLLHKYDMLQRANKRGDPPKGVAWMKNSIFGRGHATYFFFWE